MLYHVEPPAAAPREMAWVLRPGGRVFVTTNALDNLVELTVLGAGVFGSPAVDRGAGPLSLDDAERLMGGMFADVRRHDLIERYACTDPADAVAYLLSMPPGDDATPAQRRQLDDAVRQACARGNGILGITKRTGMMEGAARSAE